MTVSERILLWIVVVLLFVSAVGVVCNYYNAPRQTADRVVVMTDTIVELRHDTLTIRERVEQWRYRYDTIIIRDTVFIADIPQNYVDSTPDYKVDINAVKLYDYAIDIFRVDTFTRYIAEVPVEGRKQSRRGFGQSIVVGLQVGYGLGMQPSTMQARFEPYIGIGVVYGWGYHW